MNEETGGYILMITVIAFLAAWVTPLLSVCKILTAYCWRVYIPSRSCSWYWHLVWSGVVICGIIEL
jgi:hypothetical protein